MSYSMSGGWEHALDVYLTHDPREDEEPVEACTDCGDAIYEGESYYKVDGVVYCEKCMQKMKYVAERED